MTKKFSNVTKVRNIIKSKFNSELKCSLKNLFITFFEKYKKLWFLELQKFLLKYKKFFKLVARKLYSPKYKTFFQSMFFLFFELEKFFPEM